jgi:AcrR family transcriptional regulator
MAKDAQHKRDTARREVAEPELPTGIATAWGLRARPVKGPRPGLTLEGIVAAGVEVTDAEGLDAVSMAKVAARLGTAPMSLYRHITSKSELLALVADAVLGEPPELPTGWRAGLEHWCWAQHAVFREHPWALRLPSGEPPTTPHQIAWLESGLAALLDTGLGAAEQLSVMLLVGGYVRSEATLTAEVNAAFHAAGSESRQALADYGRLLGRLISAERFPALHTVIAAGVFERGDDPGDEFAFGLARVLDGVGVLIGQKSGHRHGR